MKNFKDKINKINEKIAHKKEPKVYLFTSRLSLERVINHKFIRNPAPNPSIEKV